VNLVAIVKKEIPLETSRSPLHFFRNEIHMDCIEKQIFAIRKRSQAEAWHSRM